MANADRSPEDEAWIQLARGMTDFISYRRSLITIVPREDGSFSIDVSQASQADRLQTIVMAHHLAYTYGKSVVEYGGHIFLNNRAGGP